MDLVANTVIKKKYANEGGLIGGWFSFEEGGQVYGISCNHVIANINQCKVGDVLADITNNEIGALSHWLQLQVALNGFINKAEFALFKPSSNYSPTWRERPGGFIQATVHAGVIFRCYNYESTGAIMDINHPVSITWNNMDYHFKCIEISSVSADPFSKPGHSGGSVLCDGKLLGIILGISDAGDRTYVVPFVNGILKLAGLFIHD